MFCIVFILHMDGVSVHTLSLDVHFYVNVHTFKLVNIQNEAIAFIIISAICLILEWYTHLQLRLFR